MTTTTRIVPGFITARYSVSRSPGVVMLAMATTPATSDLRIGALHSSLFSSSRSRGRRSSTVSALDMLYNLTNKSATGGPSVRPVTTRL